MLFTQPFNYVGVPVSELDHDMLTVLFGTKNMVWCEELVLSKPLCSGLFLSCPIWSCLICGGPLDVIARTPSNEIILSAQNVRCFLSYTTKRYKGSPASCWGYLLSHSTMLGFLSLWAWPRYVTVLFGTRNMVWCEELVLSKPLCSGLVLSVVVRWMVLPEHHQTKSF